MKVVTLVVAALAVTGCNGQSVPGDNGSSALAPKNTYAYVTVWPQGKTGKARRYGLPCGGGGGEFGSGSGTRLLPHSRVACRRLVLLPISAFAPVARDVACTEVYGGPQVAVVSGRIAGKDFRATFTRTDGCEIARWNRVRFLFPSG